MASPTITYDEKLRMHVLHNGLDKIVNGYLKEAPTPVPPTPPGPSDRFTLTNVTTPWDVEMGTGAAYVNDDRLKMSSNYVEEFTISSGVEDPSQVRWVYSQDPRDGSVTIVFVTNESNITGDVTFSSIEIYPTEVAEVIENISGDWNYDDFTAESEAITGQYINESYTWISELDVESGMDDPTEYTYNQEMGRVRITTPRLNTNSDNYSFNSITFRWNSDHYSPMR